MFYIKDYIFIKYKTNKKQNASMKYKSVKNRK